MNVTEPDIAPKEFLAPRLLKIMNEAWLVILKITLHSPAEYFLATTKEYIRVTMGIACLFREYFICNVRRNRDGYPVWLNNETFSDLLKAMEPFITSARR